jgi:hypothetical protein
MNEDYSKVGKLRECQKCFTINLNQFKINYLEIKPKSPEGAVVTMLEGLMGGVSPFVMASAHCFAFAMKGGIIEDILSIVRVLGSSKINKIN